MAEMKYGILPHNTQIELVEGCNRMCKFCGIHSIWKHKEDRVLKFMDINLAIQLAKNFGEWWTKGKRIEFAMHGEPTLHPDVVEIIHIFRDYNPKAQLQLTTNGIQIRKYPELINDLFDAGLNILIVDTYTHRDVLINICKNSGIDKIIDYYEDPSFNPYYYHNSKIQVIIIMGDVGKKSGTRPARKLLNQGGNSNNKLLMELGVQLKQTPLNKKCSRPFREIVIHYDGTIPLCCQDWRHEFIIGKFPDISLEDIWESDIMNTMRKILYNKLRINTPCYYCDYNGGFRLGFLKDMGAVPTHPIEEIVDHLNKYSIYRYKNARPYIPVNKKSILDRYKNAK